MFRPQPPISSIIRKHRAGCSSACRRNERNSWKPRSGGPPSQSGGSERSSPEPELSSTNHPGEGKVMEPNTIAVVLNPAAGGGKTLKALPKVHLALQSLGRPYQVYLTTAAGDGVKAA